MTQEQTYGTPHGPQPKPMSGSENPNRGNPSWSTVPKDGSVT